MKISYHPTSNAFAVSIASSTYPRYPSFFHNFFVHLDAVHHIEGLFVGFEQALNSGRSDEEVEA
ncbi:MAG: hypothetical protein IPM82_14330 [Saprospiraceae bacterium]|nr:hypothetical protein [Saprospiraceae bacterium]